MSERIDRGGATDLLQRQLRDLLCLAVVGDHVRWVVTGERGVEIAAWLTDTVPRWRALGDRVAKHLVALGVAPDGRVRSLAKDIPLNWVPDGWLAHDEARRLLTDRLKIVAGWAEQRRSQPVDRDTAKLLDAVCAGLERRP
jgi:starvation-inducible DNA-binding protein